MSQIDATWIFWLPLLLLFFSTMVGAIVKNRTRDACLKQFHGSFVLLKTEDGRWFWGVLHVYSTCLELNFRPETAPSGSHLKRSYVFYEPDIQTIASVFRYVRSDSEREERRWQDELHRITHRSSWQAALRQGRNLLNILRDAFSQSIGLVVGLAKANPRLAAVPTLDQRGTEIGKHLLAVVPNAYEPILERYRGHEVVVQSLKPGFFPEQAAILEEYTEKFLLLRDVPAPPDVPEQALPPFAPGHFDAVNARRLIVVRHLAEPMNPSSPAEILRMHAHPDS